MEFNELKNKETAELKKLLLEKREEFRELRFRVARGEEKDVRRIRETRKEIAHLLTAIAAKS